ncbi:nuclear transport factor 2 family protein [Alkalihalobacterium elongatum]|uniref:nuclear transport factor 2 family protein n=1 Tax=Alkalihalobacterium elongatum TaxID=2675466 RepID=UPI001C1F86BE|nr:nuclear transport factor 2 family protein [Alkalihalobacterium elongatum]
MENLTERFEISELLNRSAYGYDERDIEMLEACFTSDAEMSIRIDGGDLIGPFTGKNEIMKLMTDSMTSQTDKRRHIITNIFFESESKDAAKVISNLSLYSIENGEIKLISSGVYRDEVVKIDGEWRLKKHHLDLDLPY